MHVMIQHKGIAFHQQPAQATKHCINNHLVCIFFPRNSTEAKTVTSWCCRRLLVNWRIRHDAGRLERGELTKSQHWQHECPGSCKEKVISLRSSHRLHSGNVQSEEFVEKSEHAAPPDPSSGQRGRKRWEELFRLWRRTYPHACSSTKTEISSSMPALACWFTLSSEQ